MRLPPALLLMTLMVVPAAGAAEPEKITEITAEIVDEGQVKLDLTYPGGACDKPGEAEVTAATNNVVSVTIPTTKVAEVCTMQIVPVAFSQVIAIEPGTQSITVTVLSTDGQPYATGSVGVGSTAKADAPSSTGVPAKTDAPASPAPSAN